MATGGGGRGSYKCTYGGGSTKCGGGGHVILTSHVLQNWSNLLLSVGGRGESTSVTTEDGSSVILAPAGEDGGVTQEGYSGGGSDGQQHSSTSGGSDGSD